MSHYEGDNCSEEHSPLREPSVYVAGNFRYDRYTVTDIAGVFEDHGYHITYKWYAEMAPSKQAKAAADLQGVLSADTLIVLMRQHRNYRGTWVEIGVALAAGMSVYMIGSVNSDLVFLHLPAVRSFEDFPDKKVVTRVKEVLDGIPG